MRRKGDLFGVATWMCDTQIGSAVPISGGAAATRLSTTEHSDKNTTPEDLLRHAELLGQLPSTIEKVLHSLQLYNSKT